MVTTLLGKSMHVSPVRYDLAITFAEMTAKIIRPVECG